MIRQGQSRGRRSAGATVLGTGREAALVVDLARRWRQGQVAEILDCDARFGGGGADAGGGGELPGGGGGTGPGRCPGWGSC
jgi:hypothetical protein